MRKQPLVFRSVARRLQLGLSVFLLAGSFSVLGADMKLEAKLIWGTNDDSAKTKHEPLDDPKLTENLRGIFKWKHYYEITNRVASIPSGSSQSLTMSPKCTLKVKNLGSSRIEVDFYGNGKLVNKGVHSLPPGEKVTLAGNDKNDSAWFIVLGEMKAEESKKKKD